MGTRRGFVGAVVVLLVTAAVPIGTAVAGVGATDGGSHANGVASTASVVSDESATHVESAVGTASGEFAASVVSTETTTRVASARESPQVVMNYELASTDEPGVVRVRATADLPDSVTELEVELPPNATLRETDGFDEGGGLDVAWDGTTTRPTLAYTVPVNRTDGTFGGYDFVGTEEWATVDTRDVNVYFRWRYRSDTPPEPVQRFTTTGAGYVGTHYAHLGAHDRSSVNGTEMTLVVSRDATLEPGRTTVATTLRTATEQLRVGGREESVAVIVGSDPIGPGGISSGTDVVVNGREPVSTPNNVWVHEYVHTRQAYEPAANMTWFDEASAEYYAALLTLRQGRIDYRQFVEYVQVTGSGTLTDPSSWESDTVEYTKGSLVVAALDVQIRRATNGSRTLQDVFRQLNEQDGTVTYPTFAATVSDVAGTDLRGWLDRHVAGGETPQFPADVYAFTAPSGTADPDGDGVADAAEREAGTNPFAADTDDDGLADGAEIDRSTDPTVADTDGDGLDDGREVELATDPTAADTDGDGLDDDDERFGETDPTAADTDGDGLDDGREVELGTDPTAADTDGDGVSDGREVEEGTDPLATPTATQTTTSSESESPTAGEPTESGRDGTGDAATSTSAAGFGALVAVVAVVVAALLARRRR